MLGWGAQVGVSARARLGWGRGLGPGPGAGAGAGRWKLSGYPSTIFWDEEMREDWENKTRVQCSEIHCYFMLNQKL